MFNLSELKKSYLNFCKHQKNLNDKTIKAYNIDINQFIAFMVQNNLEISRANLIDFISAVHEKYKPKSAKRKIASVKAFFVFLEYEDILTENPFAKIKIKFKEPFFLPRTIPLSTIEKLFSVAYKESGRAAQRTQCQASASIRDIAVLELIFASGVRVSELCSLRIADINLEQGDVRIYGKGSKERMIQLTNIEVLQALRRYFDTFQKDISETGYFFVNRLHQRLSEQSVRFMINKYVKMAGITGHITPHMFRHSVATLLLEEDVDIRYIQALLGHSSIVTTQIYTHVAAAKQRDIMVAKHPRNKIVV